MHLLINRFSSLMFAGALMLAASAHAQILTFNLAGTSNPGQNGAFTTTSVKNSNLTLTTGLSLGSGLTGNAANNRYNANSWSTGATFDSAQTGNDFLTFKITANSGYELDLAGASLSFTLQNSGTGPDFYSVRSSVDGFASNLSASSAALNAAGATTATSFLIPGTSNYDNLTTAVEFRIYGWGATSAAGTMSVNALSLGGSVNAVTSAIPEPSTYAAIFGALALAGVVIHRRRQSVAA